ncbi:hypothetical protein CK203_013253 [Vitis vinifera]|uniref:Uncharacterized protein n=1 Tax=Vitis vinifera TaxID=29760 RepID=A0A438JPV6_VITVI|nr:hypothetical protein CK203_013253 [Vitis vinifera]
MASYSASLLEAGNPNRMACSRCYPVGDCSRSPTLDPDDREAPSTRKVHHFFSLAWVGTRSHIRLTLWPIKAFFRLGLACVECCEGVGQLTRPPGGLGSKDGAFGWHSEGLRPLAPFFNTWFLHPLTLC